MAGNKSVTVSGGEQMEIQAKAAFKIDNNRHYRKLLDLFASGEPIHCQTAEGYKFILQP